MGFSKTLNLQIVVSTPFVKENAHLQYTKIDNTKYLSNLNMHFQVSLL